MTSFSVSNVQSITCTMCIYCTFLFLDRNSLNNYSKCSWSFWWAKERKHLTLCYQENKAICKHDTFFLALEAVVWQTELKVNSLLFLQSLHAQMKTIRYDRVYTVVMEMDRLTYKRCIICAGSCPTINPYNLRSESKYIFSTCL